MSRRSLPVAGLARVAVLALLLAGCGPASGRGAAVGTSDGTVRGPVVVQAAASLTDAFTAIAADFRAAHPGVEVTLNLAGSQALAAQVLQGAPADLFASASPRHMQSLAAEGLLAAEPRPFAANRLAIAVQAGNPRGITTLEDLADDDVVVVLAAPEVPAGAAAQAALRAAGVAVAPASLELDVRAVLAKVATGEADAGLVYASDLATADAAVEAVAVPAVHNAPTTYVIAPLAQAPNPDAARAFIAHVRSPPGQAVLAAHGFLPP